MVRAVVLTAGSSSRMGRPKSELPLTDPGDTFLTRLIRTLIYAGLPDIVVVTGAHPEPVETLLRPGTPRVRTVHNPVWRDGQLSSLLVGLAASAPARVPIEAAMIALVDVPLVSVDTIRRVLAAWRATPAKIVRPARGDEHGHPVLFDASVFSELWRADPKVGAKEVVRAHEKAILNVPVEDPGAFLDFDNNDDYERWRSGAKK
jgi:molybdenum cofactor cytidylyltransferase